MKCGSRVLFGVLGEVEGVRVVMIWSLFCRVECQEPRMRVKV